MDVQQPQRAGFIRAHLAAKADDVGEHDRGQPPILSLHCAAGVFLHRQGLFCWRCISCQLFTVCWLTLYGPSKFLGKCRAALQPISRFADLTS